MPLTLELKSGDKLIINGAVIEGASPLSKLTIHNRASILRGKEIMTEEDANTPARRVYFALQGAYIFPTNEQDYLHNCKQFLDDFVKASPSSAELAEKIRLKIVDKNLYGALKASHDLIEYEDKIMKEIGISLR